MVVDVAITEVGVVRVNLTRALRRVNHELVLGVNLAQQLIDRWVNDSIAM